MASSSKNDGQGFRSKWTPSPEFAIWFQLEKEKHSGQGPFTTCPACPGVSFQYSHEARMESHYWEIHAPLHCVYCLRMCHGMRDLDAHKGEIHAQEENEKHQARPSEKTKPREKARPRQQNHQKRPQFSGIASDDNQQDPSRPPMHYEVLGVRRSASQEEIEKAARKLRVACHPDKLKRAEGLTPEQLEEIDEKAKCVGWAAEVLSDPLKRALYDKELMASESRRG